MMDYFIAGLILGALFAFIWHYSARLYGSPRHDRQFTVHEDAEYMAYGDPTLYRQWHSARDENGNAVN